MQNIQTTLLPFNLHRKTIEIPSGLTIQQMIDHVIPHKPRAFDVVVTINGEQISHLCWKSLRPKPSALVSLNVMAGKGGGKNPLMTILSIALLIAAPQIALALPGFGGAWIGTTYLTSATIYRVAIGVVGILATSMLASAPQQPNTSNAAADAAENPTNFIQGSSNNINQYGVISANLGTNRMYPDEAALPYTETQGNDQYVRQLFTWGYGDVIIENRQIGETDISQYTGVTMEDRLDSDLNQGTSLYTNSVFEDGQTTILTNAAGYILRTTQEDVDEASVDITFAQGLSNFNANGNKIPTSVQFEIRYTATGGSDWSTGAAGKAFGSSSVVAPNPPVQSNSSIAPQSNMHLLVIDIASGVPRILTYSQGDTAPVIPDGMTQLASFQTAVLTAAPYTSEILNFQDDRAANIPSIIADGSSFVPTFSGMTVSVSAGTFSPFTYTATGSQSEALRVTRHMIFPENGTYDVQIRRITADATVDTLRDVATYTVLRSITYTVPVLQPDISGTAMRILGTDQLNGQVDQFNAVVTTKVLDFFEDTNQWIVGPSSNPASIYRYVLQAPAFVKRLPNDRINIKNLQKWHAYCKLKGLTYNRIIDYETSVDDVLSDIAAAGMATPHKVDSIYGVIIDNERPDIVGMVNPRNSWGYSGNINYPEIPDALRVQFKNKDIGYATDEVIVYQDGFNKSNAEVYEVISFLSCTDSDLAWYYGRIYLASIILQPETHKFSMDWENLSFNRGDRITFINDCILVGVGQGRIKSIILDPDDDTKIVGFTIDDIVSIPSTEQFAVRIRQSDASGFNYYLLTTVVGETNTFTFATEVAYDADTDTEKWIGSLCNFVQDGEELDLIVTDIGGNPDQSANITAINYAPERWNSTTGTIPPFVSNITIPLDLLAPFPPILGGNIQSDETVMTRNSDGSLLGRMIIPLTNVNEASILPLIKYRRTTTTQWLVPNILTANANMVVLTGFDDGMPYDFQIRYQRPSGRNLISAPLLINNQTYVGASSIPDNVADFKVSSVNAVGLFEWILNKNIDISYYEIRFTKLTTGASWENAQEQATNLTTNRASLPMQSGTYLIKAFDYLGNESAGATTIVSFDDGISNNVVEFLQEQPNFLGTKDNCHVIAGALFLEDPTAQGIYYFEETIDLGDVYTSVLSGAVVAAGRHYTRVRTFASIRALSTVRAVSGIKIRALSDIRAMGSIRGIDPTSWNVALQMRVTNDDPSGSPTWSAWENFIVGNKVFRAIQFRLVMNSLLATISPRVETLEVTVDMPDRHESDQDVNCPSTGLTVTYDPPFKDNPAVNITLQNGATDDKLVYTSKDNTGFTVKVYNGTLAGYVTRTLDYESSGYGRSI